MFGDTIYVANGVYEEQVIMIPGLTLIGAGMDSCVIDTRQLVTPSFWAREMMDSCSTEGFHILVSEGRIGGGVNIGSTIGVFRKNLISNTSLTMIINNSNVTVEDNIFLETDDGIFVLGLLGQQKPKILSNLMNISSAAGIGIQINITSGLKPEIINNTILLNGKFATGYAGGLSDTVRLFNNLILANYQDTDTQIFSIANTNLPTLTLDNYIYGNYEHGIAVGSQNLIKNNVTVGGIHGISFNSSGANISFNNSWNNLNNYHNFLPDTTNLSVDPMIVNDDISNGELDFHLQMFSPLIDAGNPQIFDVDGSRSDIGLYGGPFGEMYTYLDLAPKPPRNLSAVIDSQYITLSWNRNSEADFKSYSLFRDTTANFTADSITFVIELMDTFYQHIIPPEIDAFYYKLTAADNQGNESEPSEELAVVITSVKDFPATVSNYQLYQNYPNPFNPSTKIGYKLKERGYVKLYVYDIKGGLVSVLVNQTQDAGYYEVEFSAGVGTGQRPVLASGIYIYQIMVKNGNNIPVFSDMKKMLLVK